MTTTMIELKQEEWLKSIVTSWTGGVTWIRYRGHIYYIPNMTPVEIGRLLRNGGKVTATYYHERQQIAEGCTYCGRELAAGNEFFPPHDASRSCESGRRNHCTCDICF